MFRVITRRNKLAIALVFGFLCFLLAPLYFNLAEPKAGWPQNKCDKHITDPAHDPRSIPRPNDDLKVIRLTNSGEFVDRCDLTNALYELNWDRARPAGSFGATVAPGASSLPKLAVLYIHGWKHNADTSDTDRKQFEQMIIELRRKAGGKRRIVGMYVGWNAEAPLWGWLENATFWVKKNNADRIAQSSSVTQIVNAVGSIVNSGPIGRDQFIAIGHSFGARLLFSATAQPIVAAVARAHPGYPGGTYKVIDNIADAIVLLNPAFEASRYTAINGYSRNDENFSERQAPLLIAISSDGDSATKTAFPIGQWLGLARTARELSTLGNYEPFQTHTLSKGQCPPSNTNRLTEIYNSSGLCLQRTAHVVSDQKDDFTRTTVSPHNPFIVARTSRDIIKDHNDIWNDNFRGWLVELIAALQDDHISSRSVQK